jgi:hypothetical protein
MDRMSKAATHYKKTHQGDEQDGDQAHSARTIAAAAVSVKPTATEEQNQQDNEKQQTNRPSYLLASIRGA